MSQESDKQLPALLTAAHELKTPLALIRQLSQTRDYYDAQQTQTALQRIELTAQRSLRLVELLTQSHWADQLDRETIQLNRLCEEIIHELTPLATHQQQRLELRLPAKPLLAVGNPQLVSSVLFGLCDNALAASKSEAPIILKAGRKKTNIRIGIDSDQVGLPSKIHANIGRQPLQPNLTTGGSGLGLYIASRFAQAMQGTIGLSNRRAGRQTFYLDVPHSAQMSLL